jgi:hypothetical protein
MITATDDIIQFVDMHSLHMTGAARYQFWELTTNRLVPESPDKRKYDLALFSADCRNRTMTGLEDHTYVGKQYTSRVGGSINPIKPPPESIGERILLFVCDKIDKYSGVPIQSSIYDAIFYAENIGDGYTSERGSGVELLSDYDIDRLARSFNELYAKSGMSGVTTEIQDCYGNLIPSSSTKMRANAAYCVTMDIVGERIDSAFRADMAKKIGKEIPHIPFFEERAWLDRMKRYVPYTTTNHDYSTESTLGSYATAAEAKLEKLMGDSDGTP